MIKNIKQNINVEMLAIASLLLLLVNACTNDQQTGLSLLNSDDQMRVGTDTFTLSTYMVEVDNIPSNPDSLLLGEADNKLGTIHADFITQLTCPEGFVFPENAVLDSAIFTMYYQNWYGNGNSPMAINIYQLDKKTLDYDSTYWTNIDVLDYCSMADSTIATEQPRIITAASPTDSISTGSATLSLVRLKLSQKVVNSLFNNGKFTTQEQFNNQFKGLYITTEFGSSTVLYINSLATSLYYHFTYQIENKDTTINDAIDFYKTDEIKAVNHIQYINRSDFNVLLTQNQNISYVESPAHIYTVLNIPMEEMVESIKDSILQGKRPYVNSAKIKLYATNYVKSIDVTDINQWSQPPTYMLMITEDKLENFFNSHSLPNDTSAIISTLGLETDSLETTRAYYTFNISTLLTQALKNDQPADTLKMFLIPVAVESQTSATYGTTVVTSIKPLQTITTTAINTQYNADFPLRLSVVATGL